MSPPSIQKAGQIPCPRGILTRASKRPYACENCPGLQYRAEVIVFPRPHPPGFLLHHFDDEVSIVSESIFFTVGVILELIIAPAASASFRIHLFESTAEPSGPLNSSLHTSFHEAWIARQPACAAAPGPLQKSLPVRPLPTIGIAFVFPSPLIVFLCSFAGSH